MANSINDKKIHPNSEGDKDKKRIRISADGKVSLTKSNLAKLRKDLPKKVDLSATSATETKEAKKSKSETADENVSETVVPVLTDAATEISIPLSAEAIRAFQTYASLLVEWNKVMNLTGIVDGKGIALRHFIDSLTLVPYIEKEQEKKKKKDVTIVDVGTGAGFPGIPLKVVIPELKLDLLDSLQKRLNFLDTVCAQLEFKNAKCIHSRAEDAGRNKLYREKYDIATARAVASLPVLCEYCLPFVKVGGVFIAMKGHVEEEFASSKKAIAALGGTVEKVEKFRLPGTDMDRSVIVIRKLRHTPAQYPRQAGKPEKDPIS